MIDNRYCSRLQFLVEYLCQERGISVPANEHSQTADELWTIFRALVNTRQPQKAALEFYEAQDQLLQNIIEDTGIVDADALAPVSLRPDLFLWRGDITTLRVDAIVNAANSQLLGCWVPGHHCIDNAIHTFAGVQLREECAQIMEAQGYEEPTGCAKITAGYNLPAAHVLHTVGPIAAGRPADKHCKQLASCYNSCLDLAAKSGLSSVAFCSISTGVFGFPQAQAAPIAIHAITRWLDAHPNAAMKVICNVFSAKAEEQYRSLLERAC